MMLHDETIATSQEGLPVRFCRRTLDQSNLSTCPVGDIHAWHDQSRMVDEEGYPYAYLNVNGMRPNSRRVAQRSDGLHADVRIAPIPQR